MSLEFITCSDGAFGPPLSLGFLYFILFPLYFRFFSFRPGGGALEVAWYVQAWETQRGPVTLCQLPVLFPLYFFFFLFIYHWDILAYTYKYKCIYIYKYKYRYKYIYILCGRGVCTCALIGISAVNCIFFIRVRGKSYVNKGAPPHSYPFFPPCLFFFWPFFIYSFNYLHTTMSKLLG